MFKAILCALSFCIAAPVTAQAFVADNRVEVTATNGGFAVQGDAGFGARGMWCAAADYARSVLGAAGTARVYVSQGRSAGLGQRSPVVFTLSANGLTPTSVFIVGPSLRQPGANLSVDHAYSFCADARMINR